MEIPILLFLFTTAIAVALNVLFKRFEIPTIIGYVVTGIIISQVFSMSGDERLSHIAEFGIVFLMFTIGLEFSVEHLMSMKKEVFVNGGLQVGISGFIYMLLAHFVFKIDLKTSIVIGFALALSSTAIVLKILNDNGDIHTVYGRKTLGILLFQDIAVIPLFIMIKIFTSTDSSLVELLTQTLTSAFIVLVLLFLVGKYILNRFLLLIIGTDSHETFIATILFLVVGASYFAHYFGFSYSLGAFLAGMLIAETNFKYQIEADLIPFRNLLLGLFFITVGMQVNFSIIAQYWVLILGLVIGVMLIKTGVIFGILRTYKNKRVSFKSAIAISQVGEFSLAIFELSRANGLIEKQTSQILIVAVIISMFLTPFILKNIKNIADTITNIDNVDNFKIHSAPVSNHIVVVGYSKLGREIAKKLKQEGINYVIIEHDILRFNKAMENHEPIIFGNAALQNILQHAKVSTCKAIIVAISNESSLELICANIKSLKKSIHTVVKVGDEDGRKMLEHLNIRHILNESDEIAKSLVAEALRC